jgi:hypothetical protein
MAADCTVGLMKLGETAGTFRRGPCLGFIVPILAAARSVFKLLTRNEFRNSSNIICGNQQQATLGIESVAAPSHAANLAGNHQRALEARGRRNAFVAECQRPFLADVDVCGNRAPDVSGGEFLRSQRWRRERKWLGRRCHFARNIALRDRSFFYWKHRQAGITVQHIKENLSCFPRSQLGSPSLRALKSPVMALKRCHNPIDRGEPVGIPRPTLQSSHEGLPRNPPTY